MTDACAVRDGVLFHAKALTTPFDLTKCFLDVLGRLSQEIYGEESLPRLLAETDHIRYSTTQGTNSVVERKGPMLGLILARGNVLLAQGRPGEVQELLKPVLIDAGVGGRVRWQVELLVLDAIAKADSGDEAAAIRQIGRALSLSSRTGMIRTYVDEGPAAKRLLLKAHASWAENPSHMRLGVPSVHLEVVLDAFGRDGLFRGDEAVLEIATGDRPDLSDRERDVLKAVFVGQSNKQIARELGVAESTVAWHLRNIYSKLNVTRRTEAVAAALAHSLF